MRLLVKKRWRRARKKTLVHLQLRKSASICKHKATSADSQLPRAWAWSLHTFLQAAQAQSSPWHLVFGLGVAFQLEEASPLSLVRTCTAFEQLGHSSRADEAQSAGFRPLFVIFLSRSRALDSLLVHLEQWGCTATRLRPCRASDTASDGSWFSEVVRGGRLRGGCSQSATCMLLFRAIPGSC